MGKNCRGNHAVRRQCLQGGKNDPANLAGGGSFCRAFNQRPSFLIVIRRLDRRIQCGVKVYTGLADQVGE